MIFPIAFLLLQTALFQPQAAQAAQGDDLRIIAVEQTGKPPFAPEGRIYRLGGGALQRIKPGDILILKRPKEERTIGSLRVISVQPGSATASLEVRGETFPLKGDTAVPLAPVSIPSIQVGATQRLKDDFAFPLNPIGTLPINTKNPNLEKVARQPDAPRTLEAIAAQPPPAPPEPEPERLVERIVINPATGKPLIVEQNPIYYLADSSAISEKGIEKLQQWTKEWGKKNVKYFLAVPQSQVKLEKLLAERLAGLQRELSRLGIAAVEYRLDARNITEPFDTIYVGVER
jgi:hypothetical protein